MFPAASRFRRVRVCRLQRHILREHRPRRRLRGLRLRLPVQQPLLRGDVEAGDADLLGGPAHPGLWLLGGVPQGGELHHGDGRAPEERPVAHGQHGGTGEHGSSRQAAALGPQESSPSPSQNSPSSVYVHFTSASQGEPLGRVRPFATPGTVAHLAPLSMGFSRQEHWSGCHSFLQRIFLSQGSNPSLLHCRQTLYHLSHQGSSDNYNTLAY